MKKNISVIIFFFLFFFNNISIAEDLKIGFVDVDKVIYSSNAGKKILKELNNDFKKKKSKFKKLEESLIKKENEILKQKNIISEEEINKRINSLKKEIDTFRKDMRSTEREFSNKKISATNIMLEFLNKILSKYALDNSYSLIIQKKNIIIGKSDFDITTEILDIFNKEVKNVKLKN